MRAAGLMAMAPHFNAVAAGACAGAAVPRVAVEGPVRAERGAERSPNSGCSKRESDRGGVTDQWVLGQCLLGTVSEVRSGGGVEPRRSRRHGLPGASRLRWLLGGLPGAPVGGAWCPRQLRQSGRCLLRRAGSCSLGAL